MEKQGVSNRWLCPISWGRDQQEANKTPEKNQQYDALLLGPQMAPPGH